MKTDNEIDYKKFYIKYKETLKKENVTKIVHPKEKDPFFEKTFLQTI